MTIEKPQIILFLKLSQPYGFLSNFWPCEIRYASKTWKTSEHLYQAMKHLGTSYVDDIHAAPTAWAAAKMGRDAGHPPRANWEMIKDDVMRYVLMLKFSQNLDLRKVLLDTEGAVLVEHGAHDRYWADGGNGSGQNKLGLCLMEVRKILQIVPNTIPAFEIVGTDATLMTVIYENPIQVYLNQLSKTTGMEP